MDVRRWPEMTKSIREVPIAEIETDKATVEFEAPMTGTLARILVPDGTEAVRVGEPIAIIAGEAEGAAKLGSEALPARDLPATPVEQGPRHSRAATPRPSPRSRRIEPTTGYSSARWPGPSRASVASIFEPSREPALTGASSRPTSRRIWKRLGPARGASRWRWSRPRRALRRCSRCRGRRIARRLTARCAEALRAGWSKSKRAAPHFYLVVSIELDRLLDARARLNATATIGNKVSINDFFIKAAALALRQVPEANAMWTDDALLQFEDVDISVAVATDGGLMTPVVRDADKKGLELISLEMKELASRARAGRLKLEEYQGGGFSISNLGMYAVEQFAAIINPPQSCILALGAAEKRAVIRDDTVVARTMLTATLSVDHRSVDGAVGARLLSAVKELIEEPFRMIL